jgi:uncharacterized UPF0146 family protein
VVVTPHKKATASLAALFSHDHRVKVIAVTCGFRSVVASVANKRADVVVLHRFWKERGRHTDSTIAAFEVTETLVKKGFWVAVLDEKGREKRKTVHRHFEDIGASFLHCSGEKHPLNDALLDVAAQRKQKRLQKEIEKLLASRRG